MEVEENQQCTRSSQLSKESLDFLKKICHRMAPHRKPFHQILLLEHYPHTSYKICVHLREKKERKEHYLTIILRNRAEYRLILSRRGRRPSRLKSDDIPRD